MTTLEATEDWADQAVAELPSLATKEEVAAVLRRDGRTVARYIAAGRLRAVRLEGGSSRVLIARDAVAEFLRGCA